MKKEFLLVDGYNIIYAWDNLKSLLDISLETARQKLMDILCNYQGFTEYVIILVFDGYLVKGNIGSAFPYNNINIVFTKEAETADSYIEKAVRKLPKKYKVMVATSDAVEQLIILSNGAIRISASELKADIDIANNKNRKKYIENKPPKSNLLIDNLDSDMQAWFEELRRKR